MSGVRTDPRPVHEPPRRPGRRQTAGPRKAEGAPTPRQETEQLGATAPERPKPQRPRIRTVLLVTAAVLLVLLPAALAGYLSAQQPPTYAAVADVLYTPVDSGNTDAVDREMATQQHLLTDRNALATAGRPVGRSATAVLQSLTTEVLDGSDVIRLTVEDESARVARSLAASLVAQYTAEVQARSTARLDEQRSAVEAQISALNTRLGAVIDRTRAIAASGLILPPVLQAEQRSLESEELVLRQQISALQEEAVRWTVDNPDAGMPTADVLTPATVLEEPVGPQPLRAAAAGGLLGLLLAFLLLAFTRVKRSPDVSEAVVPRP